MAVTFTGTPNAGGVSIDNLLTELSTIGQRGNYNVAMKLPKPKPPAALGAFAGLPPGLGTSTGVTAGTGAVPGDLGRLMGALRGQESSGNYGAYNSGSGASGAYQILRSNFEGVGGWDKDALGRDITFNEFMSNPGLQDAIARYKLGKLLASRGMAGAAATWYGGDWGYNHMYDKKPQNGYPSMYDYVMSVLNRAH
jgi:hypothetical protein